MEKLRVIESVEYGDEEDITESAIRRGYHPETMTNDDCRELARRLHTEENRGVQHPLKTAWTQEIWVETEDGLEVAAYGAYRATGYDGRD